MAFHFANPAPGHSCAMGAAWPQPGTEQWRGWVCGMRKQVPRSPLPLFLPEPPDSPLLHGIPWKPGAWGLDGLQVMKQEVWWPAQREWQSRTSAMVTAPDTFHDGNPWRDQMGAPDAGSPVFFLPSGTRQAIGHAHCEAWQEDGPRAAPFLRKGSLVCLFLQDGISETCLYRCRRGTGLPACHWPDPGQRVWPWL